MACVLARPTELLNTPQFGGGGLIERNERVSSGAAMPFERTFSIEHVTFVAVSRQFIIPNIPDYKFFRKAYCASLPAASAFVVNRAALRRQPARPREVRTFSRVR